jgi:hypothetical protein
MGQGRDSAGLPLTYFLQLSLLHAPGALLYFDRNDADSSATMTELGFEQTVIGLVAFLGGILLTKYLFLKRSAPQVRKVALSLTSRNFQSVDTLARYYMITGAVVFFGGGLLGSIPSATAVLSPLGSLLMVGACLRIWVAGKLRDHSKLWSTVAVLPMLPLVTVVRGGFIGYGTMWAIAIMSFLFARSNRKAIYVLLAPVAFFAGLSLWVNYAAARDDIRRLVWYEQASIADRLQRIADVFTNFEWLDLSNQNHRRVIDLRLNQNSLVGAAVVRLESKQVDYGYGAEIGALIVGLIPRALWPDKPAVGGGGSIVHDFTGIDFAEGTSVGAGQVFEFYINFGTAGVIGGFLLFGFLIGRMDLAIAKYLEEGDQRRVLFWFLVCLALMNPGGNLLETVVGAASAAIVAPGLWYLVNRCGIGNANGLRRGMAS